jgi:hypothetical protein
MKLYAGIDFYSSNHYLGIIDTKGHKGWPNDFIFFVCRALERTLYVYLEAIPEVKTRFITLMPSLGSRGGF